MVTMAEAIIGKTYVITDISKNISYKALCLLNKWGITIDAKIVVVDKTTYGYHLFHAVHPNGELIRGSLSNEDARYIWLEDADKDNFIVIGFK